MKTVIFLLTLLFMGYGHTLESRYFVYGDAQAIGGYPMTGVGIRRQSGIHAWDISGNVCPLNPPASLQLFHVRGLYLIYPKEQGLYLGGGLGALNDPTTINFSGTIEGALGYEWQNRVFFELNGIAPIQQSPPIAPVWPGLTLGMGF